jgi:hypothetical protein
VFCLYRLLVEIEAVVTVMAMMAMYYNHNLRLRRIR